MKKRTLNELRQEKEFGYKPPLDKKNSEKELIIKITITDGEKKIKSEIKIQTSLKRSFKSVILSLKKSIVI